MTSMRRFALTPGRIILLIVFFLLSALAAVMVYLPAGWVWSQVRGEVQLPPGVAVEAVGGTVWSGASLIKVQAASMQERTLRLSWDFQLPSMEESRWQLEWRLESRQSWLQGEVAVLGVDAAELEIDRGQIALAEFSEVARQNGLTLPGSITVNDLEFRLDNRQLVSARGTGRWDGGTVTWQVGDQSGRAELPAMVARLQEREGGIALDIVTEAGSEQLIELAITPGGVATMAVRRRLLQLSDMRSGNGAPDDTVFRVQNRVAL
jgi:general secretion pathway protein N